MTSPKPRRAPRPPLATDALPRRSETFDIPLYAQQGHSNEHRCHSAPSQSCKLPARRRGTDILRIDTVLKLMDSLPGIGLKDRGGNQKRQESSLGHHESMRCLEGIK